MSNAPDGGEAHSATHRWRTWCRVYPHHEAWNGRGYPEGWVVKRFLLRRVFWRWQTPTSTMTYEQMSGGGGSSSTCRRHQPSSRRRGTVGGDFLWVPPWLRCPTKNAMIASRASGMMLGKMAWPSQGERILGLHTALFSFGHTHDCKIWNQQPYHQQ